MSARALSPHIERPHRGRRRAFTLTDSLVAAACLSIGIALLLTSLGATRDLSKETVCTANLYTWFAGMVAYVNAYNSFPPHNPYPAYYNRQMLEENPPEGFEIPPDRAIDYGWDPAQGFIMQYGMGLTPPAKTRTGHGLWFLAEMDEYPDFCFCPAAKFENIFNPDSPEIVPGQPEAVLFQYAACYQVAGTCRAATPVVGRNGPYQTIGGRNPLIADPEFKTAASRSVPADNFVWGMPGIWTFKKIGDPADPYAGGEEVYCAIQAVHPSEIPDPARVYYMADSRDYATVGPGGPGWTPAGINDGWIAGFGSKIFLGTRHFGFANVLYLDGHVTRGGQAHSDPRWNMDYDPQTGLARSSEWRCSTFAGEIYAANIRTQIHIMPVFAVKGWEQIFGTGGVNPPPLDLP